MQLNKLIEFRQQVYAQGLTKARDAQFEWVDALLSNRTIQSFPELSFAPVHHRQWHSAYAALENGEQDRDWLTQYFSEHVPAMPVRLFALDKTMWCHPRAKTLSGLMYGYSPTDFYRVWASPFVADVDTASKSELGTPDQHSPDHA